jgi:hypothetical protein
MKRILLFIVLLTLAFRASAHKPSDSYLTLSVQDSVVTGQWDIALRDLDFAIGLDADNDGKITWGEVRALHDDIAAYALARLQVASAGTRCPAVATDHLIDTHTDGAYAVLRFNATCAAPVEVLGLRYGLLFDVDPQHKGLLQLKAGESVRTAIFAPDKAQQQFDLQKTNRLAQFADYVREGVWHIWIGYDHILFLLALLLPAVMVYRQDAWRPAAAFKPVFWAVVKIVTAFTVAHSITLSLATLNIITLPSRFVESVIAASVIAAALNNVFPLFRERRWFMAFLFGLIHGFGFASVLSDLGLPQEALLLALIGFNVGVEIGQLAIVVVFLPVAFALRRTAFYRKFILVGGSIVIAILALIWLIERAMDVSLLG